MSNREGKREWDHKTQQQDNLNVLLHPRCCVVYNANDARLASGCGFSEWTDWLQHITRGMKRSLQQIEKYTFPSSWCACSPLFRLSAVLSLPIPPTSSKWMSVVVVDSLFSCLQKIHHPLRSVCYTVPSRRVVCVCSADKWVYERPSESDWYHRGINQTRSATAAAERETSEGTKIRSKNEGLSYLNPVRYQDKTKPLT